MLCMHVSAAVNIFGFLSDEGPTLDILSVLDGSTPTILHFDLYLYSAYAAHYVYFMYS